MIVGSTLRSADAAIRTDDLTLALRNAERSAVWLGLEFLEDRDVQSGGRVEPRVE